MNKKRSMAIRTITGVAILTAIVIVLQLLGQFIRFGPFSVSLVLVPIVIGAALYGPWAGCWLGFVFGVVVLLQPDTGFFLNFNPFATIIVCLIKGAAAGLCAGLVYKAFEKVNAYLAVILAAIVCPVVNSGLFFIGSVLFFIPLIEEAFSLEAGQGIKFVIVGMIGLNFVFELLFNIVLSPVILRLVRLVKKEQPKAVKAAAPAKPVEEIREKASEAAEQVEEKAETLKEKAEDKVEDLKDKAEDKVEDIKEKAEDLKEKAADKAEDIKEKAADAAETVKEKVSEAADKVEDKAADIVENVVEEARDVAEDVKEAADKVEDKAAETVESVVDAAKDAAEDAKDLADKVEDKAADAVETVVDKFEDLTKKD